jgi:hypothetical protein
MNINEVLNNYLGKKTRTTEKDLGDGNTQVCDLDTGNCYVVRAKDGLIERVDHIINSNRKVRVETPNGIKQLLKD